MGHQTKKTLKYDHENDAVEQTTQESRKKYEKDDLWVNYSLIFMIASCISSSKGCNLKYWNKKDGSWEGPERPCVALWKELYYEEEQDRKKDIAITGLTQVKQSKIFLVEEVIGWWSRSCYRINLIAPQLFAPTMYHTTQ
jgi:hypothetical protein